MKSSSVSTLVILIAITLSLATFASITPTTSAQAVSYTITSATNLTTSNSGVVQVEFNSAQITLAYPQTYQFGVSAKTATGLWITQLNWYYGDGASLSLPYCCQAQISYVSNHGYAQSGTYIVTVYAYDNAGNFGSVQMTVNWAVPAYSSY
ncbi:MAG TPA: PKD domain-containing protein [Candidatus Acidoferrum sp.]|nr:PKD domain-containing protein [Candidatus Acidoferrum sp.]